MFCLSDLLHTVYGWPYKSDFWGRKRWSADSSSIHQTRHTWWEWWRTEKCHECPVGVSFVSLRVGGAVWSLTPSISLLEAAQDSDVNPWADWIPPLFLPAAAPPGFGEQQGFTCPSTWDPLDHQIYLLQTLHQTDLSYESQRWGCDVCYGHWPPLI